MRVRLKQNGLVLLLLAALAACSSKPEAPSGQVKIGKPYVIDGKTYYPEYDPDYDQTGEASWYGPGFHGKYTANGEIFNQDDLTAAHPTLPMPSLVRVTNVDNGKSLIVRINDRGPFKSSRIIDLSKASAQKLGIKGVTDVRVQFLKEETAEYLKNYSPTKPVDMFALNNNVGELSHDSSVATAASASYAPVASVNSNDLTAPSASAPAEKPQVVAQASAFQPPPRETKQASSRSSSGSASQSQAALIREVWAEDEAAPAKKSTSGSQPVQLTRADSAKQPKVVELKTASADPTPAVNTATSSKLAAKDSALSPASGGTLMIQVGSFSTEENARKIKGKLDKIGQAMIDKVSISDKTWYRVRLGPFNDKSAADAALEKVHAAGAPDARITRKI